MGLLTKLMDAVRLLIAVAVLPIILPLYYIRRVKRTIFSENLAGKVVLITAASSGLGEVKYLAYEYARRGACLALAARREDRLQAVAEQAQELGSPDVIAVRADVSRAEDCERFIDKAVSHFGRLDHLVNRTGITGASTLEDSTEGSNIAVKDIFSGIAHCIRVALPYLKRSKGKIVAIGSIVPASSPFMSLYSAMEAFSLCAVEILRVQHGSDIGLTIVSPGEVKFEIFDMFQSEFGQNSVSFPTGSTQVCARVIADSARAIVDSTCRGDGYLTIPSGNIVTVLFNAVHSKVKGVSLLELMDAVLLLTIVAALPIILPLYLVRRVKRTIFSEKLAGKVVLITAASSGIGKVKYVAYEYARRGARLAIAARREDQLEAVAKQAQELGSPDVIVVRADVSKAEDRERFIGEAVSHFGQLDHLVNGIGITGASMVEDCTDGSNTAAVDIFSCIGHCIDVALPHLKRSKGKIVVIGSIAASTPSSYTSLHIAAENIILRTFEMLGAGYGSDVGLTIVSPGEVKSEIVTAEFQSEFGQKCAKAIVDSICRGDGYLTIPSGNIVPALVKAVRSNVKEWFSR